MSSDNENTGNFDLSSVFKVQSNYLSDISNNVYKNVSNASEVAQYVYDLQNKLQTTSQTYKDANTSSGAVLSEQEKVIDILNNEQERLDEKQQIIDNAVTLEERKDMFTNDQRLRYTDYTKMMIVIIICLCIHIGLRMLTGSYGETMGQGSQVGITLLHVVNIVGGGIFIIYLYLNMQSRSEINFNRLYIPPPNPDDFITIDQEPNYDNIFSSLGFCHGESCCGPNTTYNETTKLCDSVISATPVASPSNTSIASLGNSTNTRSPGPSSGPSSGPSPGPSPGPSSNTDKYGAIVGPELDRFNDKLKQTSDNFDEKSKITSAKAATAQLKKELSVTGSVTGNASVSSPSPSPNTESFVTFNELYNINNDLLPCKVEYPYKNSSSAQPNDNVQYMKAYK